MAEQRLAEVPGAVGVTVNKSESGFPGKTIVFASLMLSEDAPTPVPSLVDYALKLAWATTESKPTRSVQVHVSRAESGLVDIQHVFAELGVDSSTGGAVSIEAMTRMFGAWPGPVPRGMPK